jgi:SAM-dependent methyltransferase
MDTTGFQDEIDFWAREFAGTGPFAELTRRRLTREGRRLEHPAWIDTLIESVRHAARREGRPRARAVDLGCGPLGTLATAHEDGRLDVIGVDPLADAYAELRTRHGVEHPIALVAGGGEELARIVGDGAIDLVYARNSLDHVQDVQRVFDEVARALRPGGMFVFEVTAWEGSREDYAGLHRFDFHVRDGELHCTDRAGSEALDLERHALVVVALSPDETPRVTGLDSVATPIRVTLVRADDAAHVARVQAELCADWRRARIAAWISPEGSLAERIASGWAPELLASQHAWWADAVLVELEAQRRTALRVLELEAGVLPSFAWLVATARASLLAFDADAEQSAAIFRERGLPRPFPVDAADALAALERRRWPAYDVVHLHDALWTTLQPAALLAAVRQVLTPGALVLIEGPRSDPQRLSWHSPHRRALRFDTQHMHVTEFEIPTGAHRATAHALESLTFVGAQDVVVDDPLRASYAALRVLLRAE